MNPNRITAPSLLVGAAFLASTNYSGGADPKNLTLGIFALVLACICRSDFRKSTRTSIDKLANRTPERRAENESNSQKAIKTGAKLPITFSTFLMPLFLSWIAIKANASLLPGTSASIGWVVATMPLAYLTTLRALQNTKPWIVSSSLINTIGLMVMSLGIIDFLLLQTRPFSVFQDVNVLAAFCNVFALPAVARLHQKFHSEGASAALKSGTAGFLFVTLFCLAATASRGGHLSFALGMLALSALLIRHDRKAWKTIAASLLLFAALMAAIAPFQKHAGSLSRLASMEGDQSAGDRIEMLKSTWRMVEDGPWYGSGLGTYKIRYLMYRSPNERSTSGDLAHNDYLQMLAEGGPVLLGLIVLLALGVGSSALRLWRSARSTNDSPRFIESAGLVGALFCLFGHAAVNFIFYVMPLAMIAGLYLGRLDVLRTDVRTFDLHHYVSRPMLLTLLGGLGLWLTATLGLQSAYYSMTTGKCELRLCKSLAGDEKFFGKFSALMAATQPSYLPAREWFVNAYTATANAATDDAKRVESARLAAKELADQIREFPALPYTYRDLANLIAKHPEAASAVSGAVSTDPTALLTESVRRNPLDTAARTQLAQRFDAAGKTEAAFALLFDDGMRWWKVAALPDSGRATLLKGAIPLAVKLGRCKDAEEMAQGLRVFLPNDPLALPAASCTAVP